jgi:three-Cys-motif partner protein
MDLLIHFSAMDLSRNIRQYMQSGVLERFAPNWRSQVDANARNDLAVLSLVHYWCNLIRRLGYQDVSERLELVSGDRNQPLYWLVLASRNPLGTKFWGEVSNVTPQARFTF